MMVSYVPDIFLSHLDIRPPKDNLHCSCLEAVSHFTGELIGIIEVVRFIAPYIYRTTGLSLLSSPGTFNFIFVIPSSPYKFEIQNVFEH